MCVSSFFRYILMLHTLYSTLLQYVHYILWFLITRHKTAVGQFCLNNIITAISLDRVTVLLDTVHMNDLLDLFSLLPITQNNTCIIL
jgi:hypothetical protein